ncbi:hypothetical protein F5B19DRAFT_476876 [Rostrohypoxylon terebratum]|nr:hypothetical protein F5B19DRAFT_476876 [Rostrohypoxylon terebratum]
MPASSFPAANTIEANLSKNSPQQLPELLSTPTDNAFLREQIREIDGDKVKRLAVLSFRSLQLHRIAKLQAELVKKQNASICPRQARSFQEGTLGTKAILITGIEYEEDESEQKEIDSLLQRYADAIRNYETLSQEVRFDEGTTYDFLGGKGGFQVIGRMNKAEWKTPQWLKRSSFQFSTLPRYPIGPLGFRELDKGRLLERDILKRIRSRFHMALLGGVALIAPVILMTLNPTVTVDLITVSISTALFSLVMVIFATDMTGKDVLTSTASYAAVMVVFLGTSLQVISQK